MNKLNHLSLKWTLRRVFAAAALLILVYVLPWWLALICAFIFILLFSRAVEALFAVMCLVTLYVLPTPAMNWVGYAMIIFSAGLVYVADRLKVRLAIFDHVH